VTLRLSRHPVLHTSYGDIQQELAQLGGEPDVRLVSEAVCRIRTRKLPDPAVTGNAGSFFKNPTLSAAQFATLKAAWPDIPAYPQPDGSVKVPAAWLIQTSGWKGFRNGNYGVHTQQALVLVNYGGASGQDIFQLSEDIRQDVALKFGVHLEREVNIL
jgi:UDP-N-acetylmuramate dehydrogenase